MRKRGPSGFIHRIVQAGVYACGLQERDREHGATVNSVVDCPACRAWVADHRAAAKARARAAGVPS